MLTQFQSYLIATQRVSNHSSPDWLKPTTIPFENPSLAWIFSISINPKQL
ncbi:MAG TPA: hypothetical protein PK611_09115 [Saprospiraceae bacterium]|nr:hypothetical protein [Saprospiraceae bacterium]